MGKSNAMNLLSEEHQLETIERLLQQTRRRLKSSAPYYLIWGWAVLLAAGGEWLILHFTTYPHHYLVWPIIMPLAMAVSFRWTAKQGKKEYLTFFEQALQQIWLGFGLLLVVFLLLSALQFGWSAGYSLIIALIGMGTFVSGGILRFRPLQLGGIFSLILSLLPAIWPVYFGGFPVALLLLVAAIAVAYLVPGYLLQRKEQ